MITGDISAMWLRDSAAQVRSYVKYAREDGKLQEILESIIAKQAFLVCIDPYANAFNESANGKGHRDDTVLNDHVWERKYEVDSLCAPLYLAYYYWKTTGMTWSGFRSSDDSCDFGYLVPANLMDDANSPSLLAMPYLGYCTQDDPIYKNTRNFILPADNPYYYEGSMAKGVGSPHTPGGYAWHISIVMQALTSESREEILECLNMLSKTHAGTNYMHESFNPSMPEEYSRPWFAWANTLFAELLDRLMEEDFWR